jgi:DinB superfamily
MNRTSLAVSAAFLACVCALPAQDANPISANLKQSWANVNGLLTKTAEKMPAENYRFKPTPEVQDFGQRMAHVIGFNTRFCSLLKGEQKTATFGATPSKEEIMAALKESADECNAVFNSLTDAEVTKTVNVGRGGQRMKLALIEGAVLEHSQEVYGYLAVYLRLKGIVPPSSDRNER